MTAGASLPAPPPSLDDRHVFSAQGVVFTLSDIARRAGVGDREVLFAGADPHGVEESFRRARGLLTADALEAWLATWGVAPDDFRAWTTDTASGTSTATPWCWLICSGAFDVLASTLLTAAAAACELDAPPTSAGAFDPAGWVERLVERETTGAALGAAIAAHRSDWTHIDTVAVVVPERPLAEELRLQVVADGTDLAGAADRAGIEAQRSSAVLGARSPAAVQAALRGALRGEVVGPLATEQGWVVLVVEDRSEPGLEDADTRRRAEEAVRHDVVSRAVARHVVA